MIKRYINYLKDNPQGYWFKRKCFGWGWVPARWQGWAVLALYMGVIVYLFRGAAFEAHAGFNTLVIFNVPFLMATAVLIFVCYKKGERPRWRWGLEDSEK
ncbi:MAG TPA: hypothetical protein DCS20_03735 [Candidatus Yonathbacteria bacterium]|nr:hypothetical protein [Candidatus Yonathbacteria bacterium]